MADGKQVNLGPKRLRLDLPRGPGKLLRKHQFAVALERLAGAMGVSLQIDGASSASETADGGALKIVGGVTVDHPWKGKITGAGFSMLGGYVRAGAVSILVPTTLVEGVTSGFAFLALTFILDVTDDFVNGGVLDTVEVGFAATVPADNLALGQYQIPLFEFSGSAVVAQSATRHIYAGVCDAGLGDSQAYLNLIQS